MNNLVLYETYGNILPNIKLMSTYETRLRNMKPYVNNALLNIFATFLKLLLKVLLLMISYER